MTTLNDFKALPHLSQQKYKPSCIHRSPQTPTLHDSGWLSLLQRRGGTHR